MRSGPKITCQCCGEEFDGQPVEAPAVHRLLVADASDVANVERVMEGEQAGLSFTSPPYDQQRDYEAKICDWLQLMKGVFASLPMADDGQVLVNLGLIHREGEQHRRRVYATRQHQTQRS